MYGGRWAGADSVCIPVLATVPIESWVVVALETPQLLLLNVGYHLSHYDYVMIEGADGVVR